MNYILEFEKELVKSGNSENTIKGYIGDISQFIKWFKDSYDREFDGKIINMDLKEYQSFLLNVKKQKVDTVIRKIMAINRFNKHLTAVGASREIDGLSELIIKKADINDKEIKVLDKRSQKKLRRCINESDNKRDIAIFEVLLNTGVRVSELINLELDDVRLTTRNGKSQYSYIKVRKGKGRKYREVPLNNTTRKAICSYLEVRPITNSSKIFIGERGALGRYGINKMLEKYCRLTGIERISPHILRHTFATTLLKEKKVDVITVSKLLGHSSTQVTIDYYIATTREDKARAVELLDI